MKPLALAVAALALAAQAGAQTNDPPRRCDIKKIGDVAKSVAANKKPSDFASYMDNVALNGSQWVLKKDSEVLCPKAVWEHLAQTKDLAKTFDESEIVAQLKILKALDEVFFESDKKALAVFAAADAVYAAAAKLKIAAATPATLTAQLGGTANAEKPSVYDKINAPTLAFTAPKAGDKPEDGAAEVQASLVAAGGKAGPLVVAFNKAVLDWYSALSALNRSNAILKKHAAETATKAKNAKDLDIVFSFSLTVTNTVTDSITGMEPVFAALANAKATADGKKWKEDGAQAGAALSKVDVRLRSALGMAISYVTSANSLAAAVNTTKAPVENPAGTQPGATTGVAGELEKKIKDKAVADANLAAYFDGNVIKDPGVLPAGADDKARQDHERRVSAWQKYQAIQSGRLVEVQDGSGGKSKQFQVAGRIIEVKDGETPDQVGSRVAQLILGGDVPSAEKQAVLESIQPGGVPTLAASGVTGAGAATGLKSDRPSCGDDKLTQSDYQKQLEQEKKKSTASRSADRQEAQREYLNELDAAKKELEECSSYGDASRRISKGPTEVAACKKAYDARVAKATERWKGAVAKYGSSDEISADDAAAGESAKTEADTKLRSFVMKTVDQRRGAWRANPEKALAYAKDRAAKEWANDHKPSELVAAYFKDQWPRNSSTYSVEKGVPGNVNYQSNLDACMGKGMRTNDEDRVDSQCLGPAFKLWLDGQIEAAAKGDYSSGVVGSDAAKKAECEVVADKIKKTNKGTLSEECKKLLGVK